MTQRREIWISRHLCAPTSTKGISFLILKMLKMFVARKKNFVQDMTFFIPWHKTANTFLGSLSVSPVIRALRCECDKLPRVHHCTFSRWTFAREEIQRKQHFSTLRDARRNSFGKCFQTWSGKAKKFKAAHWAVYLSSRNTKPAKIL